MNTKFNAENERIKKEYFCYQMEAKGKCEGTLNGIRKAILRFEEYTGFKSFRTFNKEQACGFKKHLTKVKNIKNSEILSKSTLLCCLNNLKDFFGWLGYKNGFKSYIHVPDIEYLSFSEKDTRAAKAGKFKIHPTPEQIKKVVYSMPTSTVIERRNRALIAFCYISGMRDTAITSLRLKHIHIAQELITQEPDQVKTKFSKRIDTFFFPVGEDFKAIFINWEKELRETHLYGFNDPLFPRTKLIHDSNQEFKPDGIESVAWSTAAPIRGIFKHAFFEAGLTYFNPHSFRDTLVHLGQRVCKTPEEFKAWSQNLGHENVMTTFNSYGNILPYQQGEIIKRIGIISY